ncbi:MAG: TIGR03936 family radical SAM-associated protein [Firmicutes bacterium]|nr:TIGR03936 family radical SAM-associated protein [Bacillota bacterium]
MVRIGFLFSRTGHLAYLSHLDMLRLFIRALRRADLNLAFSQGFNPHPRLTLALPLPLGVTASNEPGEVYFDGVVTSETFKSEIEKQLPEGLQIIKAVPIEPDAPALAALVEAAMYRAELRSFSDLSLENRDPGKLIQNSLEMLLQKEEILASRTGKKKKISYLNVRPYIIEAESELTPGGLAVLKLLLKAGSRGGVSPVFLLDQLALESGFPSLRAVCWNLHRESIYYQDGDTLQPLSERM